MSYLSSTTHANVISNPTGTVPGLYASVRSIFLNDLGPEFATLSEDHLKLAFSAILAFDLKPYGNGGGNDLASCLAASSLNCDDYCVLAVELYRLICSGSAPEPHFLGWNGGAVGNHAQLLIDGTGVPLLADPTIGFFAKDVTLDKLIKGQPPGYGCTKSFWLFNSGRTNIASFNTQVVNAVNNGSYKGSDLLYFVPSLDEYKTLPGSGSWATPQSWNIV